MVFRSMHECSAGAHIFCRWGTCTGNTSGSTTMSPRGDEECYGAEPTSTPRFVLLPSQVPGVC